jgi:hypothetical protein
MEEGPGHWLSPAPAVGLRLTVKYAHHVNDQLVLCGYYAFNRPIYVNPKPDPGYAFKFSRSIRSHCGVMIDGHIEKHDWGQTGSLEPAFTTDCTTRQQFSDDVKFVAARTQQRYPGVDETRALMLTREYLFDLSAARSSTNHAYAWIVHTYGKAYPDVPGEWESPGAARLRVPAGAGRLSITNLIKELTGVRTRRTDGRPWSMTVRQEPPDRGVQNSRLGDAWWQRDIGVRIRVLGQPGALAHVGATPVPYSNRKNQPDPVAPVDGVTLVSTLWAPAATFAVLHEPFEGEPGIAHFELLARADDAMVVRVKGREDSVVDDRLMIRFGEHAAEPITLDGDAERYRFSGHAYVRIGPDRVMARGGLRELSLPVRSPRAALVVNGEPATCRVANDILTWSSP